MPGPEGNRLVREGGPVAEFRRAEKLADDEERKGRRSTKFGTTLLVQPKRNVSDYDEADDDDEPEELPLRYTKASASQPLLAFPLRQWPNVPTKNSSSTFANLRLAQEDRRIDIFAVSKAVAIIRVSAIESVTRVSAQDVFLNGCCCLLAFHTEENANEVEALLKACWDSPTFSLTSGMTVIHEGQLSMKKSALAWSGRYAKMVKGRFLLFPEYEARLPSEVLPIGKVCFVRPQGDRILEVKFTHGFALMFRADSRTGRNQWVSAFAAEKKESFPISELFAEPSIHGRMPVRLERPMSLPMLEDSSFLFESFSPPRGSRGLEANPLPLLSEDSDSDGENFYHKPVKVAPPLSASNRKHGGSSQSMGSNELVRLVKEAQPGLKVPGSPPKPMEKSLSSPEKRRITQDKGTTLSDRNRAPSNSIGTEEYKSRISTCHSSFKFNETRYKGGAQPLDKSKAQLCTELANHSLRWSFAPLEEPCPMIAAVLTVTPGVNVDVVVIPEMQPLLGRSSVRRAVLRILTVGEVQEESWFVAESFHGGDDVKTTLLEAASAQEVADSRQRFSVLKSRYSRHSNNLTMSGWPGKTKDQAIALSVYALADAGILVPANRSASMSARKLSDIPPPPGDSPSSSVLPPPSPSLSRMSLHRASESPRGAFDMDDLALPPTPLNFHDHSESVANAFSGFSFHSSTGHSFADNSPSSVISFLSSSSSDSPHAPLLANISVTSSAPPTSRSKAPPPPSSSSSAAVVSSTAYPSVSAYFAAAAASSAAAAAAAASTNCSSACSSGSSSPVFPFETVQTFATSVSPSQPPSKSTISSPFSSAYSATQPSLQSSSSSSSNLLPLSSSSSSSSLLIASPPPSSSLLSPGNALSCGEAPFQKSMHLRMWTEDDCHDLESFLMMPERNLTFRSRMLCLHEDIGEISETDPATGNGVWASKVLRLFAHRMSIHKSLKEQLPELVLPLGCKGGKFVAEGALTIKIVSHRKLWLRSSSKEVHEQWLKAFTMERVLSQGVLAPSLTVESLTSDEVQQPKTPDPLIALKLKHLTRSHLNKQESSSEQRPSANLFMDDAAGHQGQHQVAVTASSSSSSSSAASSRAASPSPSPVSNADDDEIAVTLEQAFLDPFILALYEKFAKECFEAENIAYILEVRKFEDLMDIAAVVWRPDNEAITQAKAQDIYTKFVQEGADLELNIIHTIRQDLRSVFETKMNQGEDVPLSRNMFEAVTTEIMRLMRTNSWIRFRNSEYWTKVVDHVLEEGDQAHMGPVIPPFAGEFDSQQSFFGSCRRLGQHPVCFMSPVWTYEQWIKESASDFFHWRGEKTQKLDDLVKAHTSTFDGCVTLLKGAKLVLVDPKEEAAAETQIGFSYPGFVSEVVEVGPISVVSVWQLIADASDLSFQQHDWNAALALPSVGKLLMQTSPDVSDLYDKGPAGVKEAKALMSAAQLEVLHNVCLAEFIHFRGGPQALDPDEGCDLKWSSLLEARGEANRNHLEEWDNLVYEIKPKWFFMIEMVRENDPFHNALLGPSEFVLCIVVLLNLRLASVVNLKSYLTIWLADHKKKAGVSRYQAAVELMESVTQEERELVRVLVQLPSFGTLTGTGVLHAFPLDVYAPVQAPSGVTRARTQTTGTLKDRGSAAGWGYGKKSEESSSVSPPTSPPLNPLPHPSVGTSVRPSLRLPRPPLTTYPPNPFATPSITSSSFTSLSSSHNSSSGGNSLSGSSSSNSIAPPSNVNHHTASRASSLFAFFPSFKSLMSMHSIPPTSTVLKSQVAADAAAAALKRTPSLRSSPEQQLTEVAHHSEERRPSSSRAASPGPSSSSRATSPPPSSSSVRKASPSPSGRRFSAIANAKPKAPPPPIPKHKHAVSSPANSPLPPSPSTPVAPLSTHQSPITSSATSTTAVALFALEPFPLGNLPAISESDTPRTRARSTNLKTPSKAAPTRRNTKEAVVIPDPVDEVSRAKLDERRLPEDLPSKKAPLRQPPPPPTSSVDRVNGTPNDHRGSASSTIVDSRQTPKAPTKQAPVAPPRPSSPGSNRAR